ncbi:hypothetical protein VFPPC_18367 [Pochonia chlamydosporia 170]|uniref:Uncharacterized protein n=1 Tax=Pochonia chlamydosporia 170 TaxID=1380566 RepID=A0A219ANK4_METCM|nr:hypothetical protein VFPPC_18367 [Pochonia chlamydosporia 170]OWT42417.1 hypothetical protein VFPPC_18367 [Pochonia chlamydosporia 170]
MPTRLTSISPKKGICCRWKAQWLAWRTFVDIEPRVTWPTSPPHSRRNLLLTMASERSIIAPLALSHMSVDLWLPDSTPQRFFTTSWRLVARGSMVQAVRVKLPPQTPPCICSYFHGKKDPV